MSEDKKREFIAMMLDDAERLSTLIDRILGAARIEKRRGRYQLETVSMRHFLEDVLGEDRHLYEKDGRVIILEPGRDARVAIDRSAMRVVLSNLLENASCYSPRDSVIRLRVHRDLRSCRFDVVDNGQGIQGRDLKNVFKMFWRGSDGQASHVRGTGLGLYIVRNIVKDHRGKVWASSQGTGRGTTFSVRLPRARKYWNRTARHNFSAQSENRI
jgi:two-component system phosphate regulon sensor histidine kinase PhoR